MSQFRTAPIGSFSFGFIGEDSVPEGLVLNFAPEQSVQSAISRTDIAPARGPCSFCNADLTTCPSHVSLVKIPGIRYFLPAGMAFVKSVLEMICIVPNCPNFCQLKTVHRASSFSQMKALISKQRCRVCDVRQEIKMCRGKFEFSVKRDKMTVLDMNHAMDYFQAFTRTKGWFNILNVSESVKHLVTNHVHVVGYRHRMPMIKRASNSSAQTGNPFSDQPAKVFSMISAQHKRSSSSAPTLRNKHETSREITRTLGQLVTSSNSSRGAQAPLCISTAVKGKMGKVRKTITGRNVCGMARMVASSHGSLTDGPVSLSTAHIGMPSNIPFMVVVEVSTCNYDDCLAVLHEDPFAHLRRVTNGTIVTPSRKRSGDIPKLLVGDFLVRRHRTGDVVLFNRQPTLHKQSIQGFVVVVEENHKDNTTKLPATIANAFNVDFDGDEGNITTHNSTEAKIETALITEVAGNIYKEGTGTPVNGVLYNGVLGIYRACQFANFQVSQSDYEFITERVAPRHAGTIKARCSLFGIDPMSNLGVISLAFPPTFNYERGDVKISNGVLLRGLLTKSDLAPVSRGIIHTLCTTRNVQEAMFFINAMQMLGEWYTDRFVATIRHEDNLVDDQSTKQIDEMVQTAIALRPNQKECQDIFNIIQLTARKIATSKVSPNMGNMTNSGAKGSAASIAQNFAPLGAQPGHMHVFTDPLFTGSLEAPSNINMSSARVRRTSHFDSESFHPEGFGIISQNFTTGITFSSMAFLAATCRSGLLAKTISTAPAGAHQRDLSRGNDPTIAGFNGSVVHGNLTIAPCPVDAQCGFSIKDKDNVDVPFDISKGMKLLLSTDISVQDGKILLGEHQVGTADVDADGFVDLFVEEPFRGNGFASLALACLSEKHETLRHHGNADRTVLEKLFFVKQGDGTWLFNVDV